MRQTSSDGSLKKRNDVYAEINTQIKKEKGMTERGFIVAKAVEDAVKLGADAINMVSVALVVQEADTNLTRQHFNLLKPGVVINTATRE